ncbi:hypothetical protein KIPB_011350 [Kipferlia bialata]|uniref:Tr-type G domain-containing protein n=1 Tax=Kipferlia bialata TaxID=797122 RepID=A0A9K3D6C5_9EUKA|nr:hypothetical protein KIPB_011350 [Kipferlia bialata]|eukprot:g11350.t1
MAEKEEKVNLNIVFIGHVDAGKSTMAGHLMFDMNVLDDRTLEKFAKEAKELGRDSWVYSFAMDLNEEERSRGKTVECGRAVFETKDRSITVVDAPGHRNFVPHMVSGTSQADLGVLVVSARKGEYETGFQRNGQTREHALIARTCGINSMVVAINKMDDPTVNWNKDRFDEIVAGLSPFLKGCGFSTKRNLHFIPVSGFSGANLATKCEDARLVVLQLH